MQTISNMTCVIKLYIFIIIFKLKKQGEWIVQSDSVIAFR
jgi:hypothetical protein